MTPPKSFSQLLVGTFATLVSSLPLAAQWQTESYTLKPGWNAVWLPLEVSHASISDILPSAVEEIWRWNANIAGSFTAGAIGSPAQTDSQWSVWRRSDPAGTTFGRLDPNYAYLVKVDPNYSGSLVWSVKGIPTPPRYDWTSTGVNLVGFPVETPVSSSTRNLSRFFTYDPVLRVLPSTLYYNGGELSDVAPKNPLVIGNASSYGVVRYQAYWVQSTNYTEYYGPLKVDTSTSKGLDFGAEGVSVAVRVKNVAVNSTNSQSVGVTIAPLPSETPPTGQPSPAGAVPLRLRGDLDLSTGLYAYENVTAPITRTLAPGEEREFIFTVDRSALSNVAGTKYASLLKITDSLNLTRVMLPVMAQSSSRAGLWLGAAVMDQVDFVQGTSSSTQAAPAAFPIRVILHSDASGKVRLLQQAYTGLQDGQDVVSSVENGFTAPAKASARLSSTGFPPNLNQTGDGTLGLSGSLNFSVQLAHNASSNPFVHTYHPDHDNLDERFQTQLPPGRESNTITRSISFTFESANPAGFDPAWGSTSLGGTYTETVTGLRAVPITTSGRFHLQRASSAARFVAAP